MWPWGWFQQWFQYLDAKLSRILLIVQKLDLEAHTMAAQFDELVAQIHENTDTEASIVLALDGITARFDAAIAAGGDVVVMQQLTDELKAKKAAMVASILANTRP